MLQRGVIRRLSPQELAATRFWTPVFARPKKNSPKMRVITDLRALNALTSPPKFKQDNWGTLLAILREPEAQYAVRLDLTD